MGNNINRTIVLLLVKNFHKKAFRLRILSKNANYFLEFSRIKARKAGFG